MSPHSGTGLALFRQENLVSEEPKHCTEIIMCERCRSNTADVIVNLKYIADNTTYPLVALCASCFLAVYKGTPGIAIN
jgi:hypothetical protein